MGFDIEHRRSILERAISSAPLQWSILAVASPTLLALGFQLKDLGSMRSGALRVVVDVPPTISLERRILSEGRLIKVATDPPRNRAISRENAAIENASRPYSSEHLSIARPFLFERGDEEQFSRARNCLAAAIYYEAGHESISGRQAVAQVVLNRVRHPAYPNSVCAVVFQGATRATGCQFTFTCDGAMARRPTGPALDAALATAESALTGLVEPSVGWSTHYHTRWVVPYWAPALGKTALIGAHYFYRIPGRLSAPERFAAPREAEPLIRAVVPFGERAAALRPVPSVTVAPETLAALFRDGVTGGGTNSAVIPPAHPEGPVSAKAAPRAEVQPEVVAVPSPSTHEPPRRRRGSLPM